MALRFAKLPVRLPGDYVNSNRFNFIRRYTREQDHTAPAGYETDFEGCGTTVINPWII